MADEELQQERIFTIPLRETRDVPRTKRAPVAIRLIADYVTRHMKPTDEDGNPILDSRKALRASGDDKRIYIEEEINEMIWARGREKPPRSIRVKALKFEDGTVEVRRPEE